MQIDVANRRSNAARSTVRRRRLAGMPVAGALLTLALSGCSVLPNRPAVHEITLYRLVPTPAPGPASGVRGVCPAVRVSPPTAAPGFGNAAMHYSEARYTLVSFAFHRWVAPPADMLEPPLIQALSENGRFSAVVNAESPAAAPLQLDTRLLSLLQEVDGARSHVHLVISAALDDLERHRQMAARRFVIDVPTRAVTPAAGVAAANKAVEIWLQELVAWLDQQPCASP